MAEATTLHVGSGADEISTLVQARDEARRLIRAGHAVTVKISGGDYHLDTPLELGSQDGGSDLAPVTWCACEGETVRLMAGAILQGFVPVEEDHILEQLPENARGKVLQLDLKAAGVDDYGEPVAGGLELFINGVPQTLARWPNSGFDRVAGLVGGDPVDVRGTKGDKQGKLYVRRARLDRWQQAQDPWVHGYWFWDWSDQRQRVSRIDTEHGVLELEPPDHNYGYRTGQWYYAYNMLCELDEPGEWYLDRERGILYLWPPADSADLEKAEIAVSVGERIVKIDGARHLRLQDLTFEYTRGDAVIVERGEDVCMQGCTFRNVGGWAVSVTGGRRVSVSACHLHALGNGGILLSGGERPSLTRADHVAQDNHIHDYGRVNRMYQPAVQINGVGQSVIHNHIHDAPHMAVQFTGNDHLIAHNDIHHVCLESNDAGAIYSGRDWTWRGTVIRDNLMWEITGFENRGCVGVYLDDMLCGTEVTGNLFYRVTRAAMIGGGRDVLVENNLFIDCEPATHLDARAMNWASYHVGTTMKDRLDEMPITDSLWAERYPELLTIWEDEPAAPKGNIIRRNVCQGGTWDGVRDDARTYIDMSENYVADDVGLEGDAPRFTVRANSPAWETGFQALRIDEIGPRR